MPSDARSGEVKAVFGQRGQRGDGEQQNYYYPRTNPYADGVIAGAVTPHRQGTISLQLHYPRGFKAAFLKPNIPALRTPRSRTLTIIK
jgi:hypothetical protein